jgi:uncharacterized protein with von Willebrand factor type A (vWA) domain
VSDELVVLIRFARAVREAGLPVGTGRIAEFCRAATLLEPRDLYWAGRATLVARPQDIAVYDRVFAEFFGCSRLPDSGERVRVSLGGVVEQAVDVGLASPLELLREKSFARCTDEELEALAELMAGTPVTPPPRRSRRLVAAPRGAPDLRRTLRRSLRTGGDPLERAWRRRRPRPRRFVLLLDVSGSMTDYTRALVLFAHAAVRADRRCEVFCFGTRLTRLTAALGAADPDEALALAAGLALDRNAGTRIGESLKRFLDDFGHRGLARGAVVLICSDGLEIGDPALLAEQAERLARLAHRVVWLNPLKADPAYEPLTRGMRAALPHVDELASAHNLESLEALSSLLGTLGSGR